ncbi:MAG: glutamate--tRNA ligase [Anaerolineales bacterium]|nr:glutamate--tRNA ligase [Anaerolineales bacterium]
MPPARVRFAPSPTGRLHIGGARTALYNVLLAKQTGGQFILRIEDTDVKRTVPGALEELQAGLRWLGLDWQEGPDVGGPHAPYSQLARKDLYQRHAQALLAGGHAYRCFCSPQRLKQVREQQQQTKQSPRYDGVCRALSPAEAERRAAAGEPFTIRFKTPKEGATTVTDRLRGAITVDNTTLDDFILVKSDGLALYHLAAMVDDHEMGITHVFRSAEWLGTFPLHALIIRALGWAEPVWCHLSVFLKPSGKGKMSKRDVTSEQSIYVAELEQLGYLPEAVTSWMALMGASFGAEEELLSLDEMAARFNLDSLNPSAARVNFEKLDDFNGKWLRRLTVDDLAARVRPYFEKAGLTPADTVLRRATPLFQPRIVTLDDAVEMAGFFFRAEIQPRPEDLVAKGLTPAQSGAALRAAVAGLEPVAEWTPAAMEPAMRALAEQLGLKAGQFFGILRAAITGQTVSPPLFECMEVVGRELCLARLRQAERLLPAA